MADEFQILSFPQNIRTRPGTYIGSTENCKVMLKELVDNGVDEFLKGVNNTIYVKTPMTEEEFEFLVADKSTTGFKLDEAFLSDGTSTHKTIMDAAVSYIHAGTKFNKTSSQVGMNGAGTKAVNALSEKFVMITRVMSPDFKYPKHLKYNGEKWYFVHYSKGMKVEEGFMNDLSKFGYENLEDYTTIASFIPDMTIFETASYEIPKGIDYVQKDALLTNKELTIYVNDEVYISKLKDFKYSYDIEIPGIKGSKNPSIRLYGSFELSNDIFESKDIGAVNTMACHQGKHINIFKRAYKDAIKELYGDCKGNEAFGLNCFVFLKANEVDFDSQSKSKLSRITEFDEMNCYKLKDLIKSIMKEHNEEFQSQYDKIINFMDKKGELNKKQKINKLLGMDINNNSTKAQRRAGSYKPKKLKDAWSENRKECELLIFEGDSAAGSAHKTRDAKTQAIFPLRGVPLNTAKMDITKVLKNDEMKNMFRSIGAGVDGNFNLKKLRYSRIVYIGDADPDGYRIDALVVGAFLCHAKFLIEQGKLFLCETPFWIQDGKYIYSDEEDKLDKSKPFKRVKGLGGLGKHFHNCVTNKDTRRLVQVTMDDAREAIRILKDGNKKKELLLKTNVVSTELYTGEENG